MNQSLDVLWQEPALRPLAPLVLSAWHDGHLTPAELLAIREALSRATWLDEGARGTVARWLDPESPPAPQALRKLEREVSGWLRALPRERRRSLADIAAALGEGQGEAAHAQQARELLASLEESLSFDELERTPSAIRAAEGKSSVLHAQERARLTLLLDGEHKAARDELRALLAEPDFRFVSGLGTRDYREQVLRWLKQLAERGVLTGCYPNGMEEAHDIGRFLAIFETLSYFDLSLVVKFGVQGGLFAGAIENLGTAQHHTLLPAILRGELLGCFAMTERGHGSNVRSLLTSARYDAETQSFVLNTPSLAAGKEWIGNAALHARMAVVFAALETGGEGYGVHAFLVPIRDESGNTLPGVRIEDCGEKMGLNGVDNGRLWFDDVRLPRSALLDRFGQVTAEGEYQSRIPSSGKRFFTMLSTLVGGRISVAGGATSASKVGLTIAIRYALHRRQFPDASGVEKPLLSYVTHQKRLFPRLAAAYAFSFAQQELVRRATAAVEAQGESAAVSAALGAADVETLAAGIKALGTWQAIDTLQQCRECCGGQGYLTSNRIDALRTDTDVFTTFEGDNTVLLQLVANNLLRELKRVLAKRPVRTLVRSIVEDFVTAVVDRNPVAVRTDDTEGLRSFDLHSSALRFREKSLLTSFARRVARRIGEGQDAQEAFDACQDHAIALARAHIERFVVENFQAVAGEEPLIEPLCTLYGLGRIEADLAWFLENGFLAPTKSRALRKTISALVREIEPRALDFVEAFAIPESCLGPLADIAYLTSSGLANPPTQEPPADRVAKAKR